MVSRGTVSFGELNFVTDKCFSSSLFMYVLMVKFLALSFSPLLPPANEKHISSFASVGKEIET